MTVAEPTAIVIERSAECAHEARRLVADACRELARDLVEIARLLTSELVTNAFAHGAGTIQVEVHRIANRVRISVADDGQRRPHLTHADPMAPSGRGLMLVESLAARWGVTPQGPGKTVWFELRTA